MKVLEERILGARHRLVALAALGTVADAKVSAPALAVTKGSAVHPRVAGSLLTRKEQWVEVERDVDAEGAVATEAVGSNVGKKGTGKERSKGQVQSSSKKDRKHSSKFGPVSAFDIPPAFVAIPCKPVLFDIAFNYVDTPNIDARAGIHVETKSLAKENNAGGLVGAAQSLFGWFRS